MRVARSAHSNIRILLMNNIDTHSMEATRDMDMQ